VGVQEDLGYNLKAAKSHWKIINSMVTYCGQMKTEGSLAMSCCQTGFENHAKFRLDSQGSGKDSKYLMWFLRDQWKIPWPQRGRWTEISYRGKKAGLRLTSGLGGRWVPELGLYWRNCILYLRNTGKEDLTGVHDLFICGWGRRNQNDWIFMPWITS